MFAARGRRKHRRSKTPSSCRDDQLDWRIEWACGKYVILEAHSATMGVSAHVHHPSATSLLATIKCANPPGRARRRSKSVGPPIRMCAAPSANGTLGADLDIQPRLPARHRHAEQVLESGQSPAAKVSLAAAEPELCAAAPPASGQWLRRSPTVEDRDPRLGPACRTAALAAESGSESVIMADPKGKQETRQNHQQAPATMTMSARYPQLASTTAQLAAARAACSTSPSSSVCPNVSPLESFPSGLFGLRPNPKDGSLGLVTKPVIGAEPQGKQTESRQKLVQREQVALGIDAAISPSVMLLRADQPTTSPPIGEFPPTLPSAVPDGALAVPVQQPIFVSPTHAAPLAHHNIYFS